MGVDLLVTPDHKMLVVKTSTKQGRKRLESDYSLIPAHQLNTVSHAYIKTGIWLGERSSRYEVMALLGFAIGDGYISGNRVCFHLRRERKIKWLYSKCMALAWSVITHDDTYAVDVPDEYVTLFRAIYDDNREKQIPPKLLAIESRESLMGVYDGLMESDGSRSETSHVFDTTSAKLVGQFQQLCLHIGLAANIGYIYSPDERINSYGIKDLTRLHVIRRNLKPEVNKWVGQVGQTYWLEDWEGDVYCAEVPNNTLYVRRNGIPVWSGNSVLEHAAFTTSFAGMPHIEGLIPALMNRPCVWFESWQHDHFRVTCNLRTVRDWAKQGPPGYERQKQVLYDALRRNAHKIAPHIIEAPTKETETRGKIVVPESEQEKWISVFFCGSRGYSHEQVRHGDWTAISQRSTRFCDETATEWIEHPLITEYKKENPDAKIGFANEGAFADGIHGYEQVYSSVIRTARNVYQSAVTELQDWLVKRGIDKLTARKQARGAARGYLGNALATELIFSASVTQWKWMLHERAACASRRGDSTTVLRRAAGASTLALWRMFREFPSCASAGRYWANRAQSDEGAKWVKLEK